MTTFRVSTDAQLTAAVSKLQAGDTILLAAGTYERLTVNNLNLAGNVTIASADPDNPATIRNTMIRGSSNLVIRDLELATSDAQGLYAHQVVKSSNISLEGLEVHGEKGRISDVTGLMVRESSNVSVTNSEFHGLQHGLAILDNNGVTLGDNSFRNLRTDGIRGGGTSNLVIRDNYFTDFHPEPGDHPDGIQLWTTNTTKPASNITISGNSVVRGNGAQVQGIFLRDTNDDLPFENVRITGNTVIGGMHNGVSVDGVKGLVLDDNTVVAMQGERSNVRVENATGAKVTNNHATDYVYINSDGAARSGNILTDYLEQAGVRAISDWARSAALQTVVKNIRNTLGVWGNDIGWADAPGAGQPGRHFAEIAVAGTARDDRLSASTIGASRVEGGAGDDVLTGNGRFAHRLIGGAGDDTYNVRGEGDQVIEARNGGYDTVVSTINYTLGDNVEALRLSGNGLTGTGNALDNRIVGSAGNDIISGLAGDDTLLGGEGDDRLFGGDGNDDLRGDAGNDYLDGGEGDDMLIGGAGNDTIIGGRGNDVIEGGAGSDTMTGGAGRDIFRFRPADIRAGDVDRITDFQRGQDRIDLSAIDARSATGANDAFSFIGTGAFTRTAGQLRYSVENGNATIQGDVNGDGKADFTIVAHGVTVLAATDFAL